MQAVSDLSACSSGPACRRVVNAPQRLGTDIRQIEKQNNEMQLQTLNQKRLYSSLESLLVRRRLPFPRMPRVHPGLAADRRNRRFRWLEPGWVGGGRVARHGWIHVCQASLTLPAPVVQALTALSGLDNVDGIRTATEAAATLERALTFARTCGRTHAQTR